MSRGASVNMDREIIFAIFFVFLCFMSKSSGFHVNDIDVTMTSYPEGKVVPQDLGKYKPPRHYMNSYCDASLILGSRNATCITLWSATFPPSTISCKVRIQNRKYTTYDLGLTFKWINMSAKENGACTVSKLDLYNGDSTNVVDRISDKGGICGTMPLKEQYSTTTNVLTMLYTSNKLPYKSYQDFEAVITPFHKGKCKNDEFRCANGACIKNILVCDSYDNCGDDSDEKSCGTKPIQLSIAAIVGIAVGGAVLVAIAIIIICCCCCCNSCGYERL